MTQLFLSEPTIARAHKKYLESWSNPAVRKAWGGRKPSLEQFIGRFRDAYHARQAFLLKNRDQETKVLEDRRISDIQELAESVEEGVQNILDTLNPPRFAELSADEADTPAPPPVEAPKPPDPPHTTETQVKDKNKGKLPTTKQVFFLIHRAIEAGHQIAQVPVTREDAAKMRSMIGDGKSYTESVIQLRKEQRAS